MLTVVILYYIKNDDKKVYTVQYSHIFFWLFLMAVYLFDQANYGVSALSNYLWSLFLYYPDVFSHVSTQVLLLVTLYSH
jgi:hypothetical protein